MQTYLLASAVLLIASALAGLAGFGAMLLSVPLLALFLDIKTVIPLTILASLSMHILIFIQMRNHFEFKKILPLGIGALPGILIGISMLRYASKEIIQFVLGISLVLYSIHRLIFGSKKCNIKETWSYLFGFFSGFLAGVIGAGGPPVIVYTSLRSWSKDLIKATLQGYFLLAGFLVVLGQGLTGLINTSVLRLYFVALPAVIVGTYLGSRCYAVAKEESYRRIIVVLLAALGGLMIYRSLFQ